MSPQKRTTKVPIYARAGEDKPMAGQQILQHRLDDVLLEVETVVAAVLGSKASIQSSLTG